MNTKEIIKDLQERIDAEIVRATRAGECSVEVTDRIPAEGWDIFIYTHRTQKDIIEVTDTATREDAGAELLEALQNSLVFDWNGAEERMREEQGADAYWDAHGFNDWEDYANFMGVY